MFAVGRVYITPGALAALAEAQVDVWAFLARHASGDWAEMCVEDQEANWEAVALGNRVFSAYNLSAGTTLWVITEADRSATTLLLPGEY